MPLSAITVTVPWRQVAALPDWPKDRGVPTDLWVVLYQDGLGGHFVTELRASGDGMGTVNMSRDEKASCRYPIDQQTLARFDWRDFVEVISSARPRPSDCPYQNVVDGCWSARATIRAFGHFVDMDTVVGHRLEYEIEARVERITKDSPDWPREAIEAALIRFDEAFTACLDEPFDPKDPPSLDTIDLVISRERGPARVSALAARRYTRRELACITSAAGSTHFPGSGGCEQLRLTHSLPWRRSR
jgi:hypothetical protein